MSDDAIMEAVGVIFGVFGWITIIVFALFIGKRIYSATSTPKKKKQIGNEIKSAPFIPKHTSPQRSAKDDILRSEYAKRIADQEWQRFEALTRQREEEERIKRILNVDKIEYEACCKAAKVCLLSLIKTLKDTQGGRSLINKIQDNIALFTKEFILLCASYNDFFISIIDRKGAPLESDRYDFHNGAYRLCKILKLSMATSPDKANVEKSEVNWVENRIEFYQNEIDFIRKSKFGLPINLLYPLFNPEKEIDYTKAITEIDPVDCIMIWEVIKHAVDLRHLHNNEKH